MEKSGIVHRSAVGRKIFNTDKCAMGFKNHIYAFDWQKIMNFEGGNALAADCRLGGNQLVGWPCKVTVQYTVKISEEER